MIVSNAPHLFVLTVSQLCSSIVAALCLWYTRWCALFLISKSLQLFLSLRSPCWFKPAYIWAVSSRKNFLDRDKDFHQMSMLYETNWMFSHLFEVGYILRKRGYCICYVDIFGSMSISEQLRTYLSPNPKLTLTCYHLTAVGLGEGQVLRYSDTEVHPYFLRFCRDLTKRCFPSTPTSSIRCFELMCVHVGLVPVQFAVKQIRRLILKLFQKSLGSSFALSLIQ